MEGLPLDELPDAAPPLLDPPELLCASAAPAGKSSESMMALEVTFTGCLHLLNVS